MPDGSPQVTPVWVDFDGAHVRFNSALGRVKDKNVRREPRVSITIQDPGNPYRYLQVRGRVVEITETGTRFASSGHACCGARLEEECRRIGCCVPHFGTEVHAFRMRSGSRTLVVLR